MKFEEIYKLTGTSGLYQTFIYICLAAANLFLNDPVVLVFANADMPHWCKVPQLENFSYPLQKSIAIPPGEDDESSYSSCQMYALNYSSFSREEFLSWNRSDRVDNNTQVVDCDEWIYEQTTFISTSVSRFGLVCSRKHLNPLISTIFMCGYLVGGLTAGILSDRIGRKTCSIAYLVVRLIGSAISILSVNYVMSVLGRFILGVGSAGLLLATVVLSVELVLPRQRSFVISLSQTGGSIGYMLTPIISYFVRRDEMLQTADLAPAFFLLIYLALMPESLRWLLVNRRYEEAADVVRRYISINGRTLPPDGVDLKSIEMDYNANERSQNACFHLLSSPAIRLRAVIMNLTWFTTSMIYYALLLNVGTFAGDIFVNAVVSAVLEIPTRIVTIFIVEWKFLGRRLSNSGSLLLLALSSFVCAPLLLYGFESATTGVALIGKIFATMSFTIIYIYTAELFPTEVRSVALGSASVCARVGGMVAPYMGTPMMSLWKPLPYVVYGVLGTVTGLLGLLLPETLGQQLTDTVIENVEMSQENGDRKFGDEEWVKNGKVAEHRNGLENHGSTVDGQTTLPDSQVASADSPAVETSAVADHKNGRSASIGNSSIELNPEIKNSKHDNKEEADVKMNDNVAKDEVISWRL